MTNTFAKGDILRAANAIEVRTLNGYFKKVTSLTRFEVVSVQASSLFSGGTQSVTVRPVGTTQDCHNFFSSRFKLYRKAPVVTVKAPLIRIEDAPVKDFVIMLNKDGTYLPATTPRTYGTLSQAQAVAMQMAKRHGGRFVVFEAVADAVMPVQVEPTLRAFR